MVLIGQFAYAVERYIVEGIASTVKGIVSGVGSIGSKLQSGQVQTYGFITLLGIVLLLIGIVVTGGYNL
jgi:NADH-quinone oxidoreductase subunit L